jgi:Arc/MetJ family transcription regulator
MRTTIAIPDDLFEKARRFTEGRSFSHFVREAVRSYVGRLEQEALAREMAEGYQAEAEAPSLDEAWSQVETDGWS